MITLLILLVGIVNASEVSVNKTDTNSITVEKVVKDTHTLSDMVTVTQDNNNANEVTTKTISKNKNNTTLKEASEITNWQQLAKAVNDTKGQRGNITLTLGNGTYKTSGTITFNNANAVITINGNGQTIDGNKQQAFIIRKGASVVLKNVTIKNCESQYGGAIKNLGTLTITQSTFTKNTAKTVYGAVFGAAIHNEGKLTITESTFTKNAANGVIGFGGAIFNNGTGTLNIIKSKFTSNTAGDGAGGTIRNEGKATITQSTITKSTAHSGGAIWNGNTLTITESTLTNNQAQYEGGAIINFGKLTITESALANNKANYYGGAIYASKNTNLTGNRFINNQASSNKETIDLSGYKNGLFDSNIYESTDIALKTKNLKTKDNKNTFYYGEDVELNLTISLEHPNYYDKDVLERLDDITLYVNGVENAITKYADYTLSNLEPGDYTVYIKTCNQESNKVTFKVIDTTAINLTTKDIEMVQGRTVTFSAQIDYKNTTINQGKVYFEIDGKPLTDENGSTLYAPVEDNWAFLPYNMPIDVSLGNHTLTAVYTYDNRILATDNKTLTIIESIPEGAGEKEEIPSEEDNKQQTYNKDTTHQKSRTKHANTIYSAIATSHKVITSNNMITLGKTITLSKLNEIFGQTFTNGHLLLYIDGELVFNGTVNDDLSTVILEIMEKYMGKHEMKAEFTDNNNESKTYTENVTIN